MQPDFYFGVLPSYPWFHSFGTERPMDRALVAGQSSSTGSPQGLAGGCSCGPNPTGLGGACSSDCTWDNPSNLRPQPTPGPSADPSNLLPGDPGYNGPARPQPGNGFPAGTVYDRSFPRIAPWYEHQRIGETGGPSDEPYRRDVVPRIDQESFRYSSGLGQLGEENERSYAALLTRLTMVADQMKTQGKVLSAMGGAAPPCLALPYAEMREFLFDATQAMLNDVKAHGTDEQWAQFTERTGVVQNADGTMIIPWLNELPKLTEYWEDAPPHWQGPSGTSVPIPTEGLGFPAGARRPAGGKPSPISPPAASTTFAWRKDMMYLLRTGIGEMKKALVARGGWRFLWGAARSVVWKTLIWGPVVYYVGKDIYEAIFGDSPSDEVAIGVENTIRWYEDQYLPETSQQWKALIKINAYAKGNPASMRALMMAIDPWKEVPLPLTPPGGGDAQTWEQIAKMTREPEIDPLPLLAVLVLGSGGALIMGR